MRLLVLEPHPHAGLADGVHHRRRGELGRVVLDVQPLADDIGRDRLEPTSGFSRRSRMTTSSLQSIPSTRKTASACSSQTVQVTVSVAISLWRLCLPIFLDPGPKERA